MSTTASVELYDPNTNVWTSVTPMTSARLNHAIEVLEDGRVIAVGGSTTGNCEIYDPLMDTWGGNFGSLSFSFNNTILLNHKVLTGPSTGGDPKYFFPQYIPSSDGHLNGLFSVTVLTNTSFTVNTSDSLVQTGFLSSFEDNEGTTLLASAYPLKSATDIDRTGPYIVDPTSGPAITGTATTTTQDIVGGLTYSTITVTDASSFPDSGYLVFGLGSSIQTYPVKYTLKASSSLLILDSSYVFPLDLPNGTTLNILTQRGAWVPSNPTESGLFYITDSIAGRISASQTIDDISGSGLNIVKTVVYPSDKGLANEGLPVSGVPKIADKVWVFGSDDDVTNGRDE